MVTLQSLEFTRIVPRRFGFLVFAKFPHWWHEYSFFVGSGKVMGQTSEGVWLEVSNELGELVRDQVSCMLRSAPENVYS